MEIKEQITNSIAEHEAIVTHIAVDMDKLRQEMVELQKDPSKKRELVMATMARVTLEMKQTFHKGAVAALKNIKV